MIKTLISGLESPGCAALWASRDCFVKTFERFSHKSDKSAKSALVRILIRLANFLEY